MSPDSSGVSARPMLYSESLILEDPQLNVKMRLSPFAAASSIGTLSHTAFFITCENCSSLLSTMDQLTFFMNDSI